MKRFCAAILATLILFSCSACSSAKEGTSTGNSKAAKDTLVVSAITTVESYDPNTISDYDMMVMSQVFDTLFKYDANGEPSPDLAESWKDDGTSVTINLRKGVKFHDGTDFNADAVIKNYQYFMAGEYGDSFKNFTSGIKKIDDYTVVMQKATPYASLIDFCCSYLYIVSPTAYEADKKGFGLAPVGTGAYKFTKRDSTSGDVYLTANPDYFLGKPYFQNIKVRSYLDSSTALVALQNGELDMYILPTVSDYKLAQKDSNLKTVSTTGWNAMTVSMYGKPYTEDQNLRSAIYYAINRKNAATYEGIDDPVMSKDLFASEIMGSYSGSVDIGGYDPELAKQYLAKSKYNGETLEMNVKSGTENIATSIQYDLEAIGIKTKINIVDPNTWVSKIFDGTAGITLSPLGGSYGCLQEMLQLFSSAGYYGSLGILATTPECDAAAKSLATIKDSDELKAKTLDAYKKQVELRNFVSLYEVEFYTIYNSSLTGIDAKWAASEYSYLYQVKMQ